LLPNAPAGEDDNLWETRPYKGPFGQQDGLHCISRIPWDLWIVPHSSTENTIEKEVSLVFKEIAVTENAAVIICDMPVAPQKHVFHVDPIMQN
jgi:hypothetical protein